MSDFSTAVQLLVRCKVKDVRLGVVDNDTILVNAPRRALTVELLDQIRALKADLIELLNPSRSSSDEERSPMALESRQGTTNKPEPLCRCGGTTWNDVLIHGGQSVRRDCGKCGRFLDFPIWYGKTITLLSEQY
jgi:hypothetical protein